MFILNNKIIRKSFIKGKIYEYGFEKYVSEKNTRQAVIYFIKVRVRKNNFK